MRRRVTTILAFLCGMFTFIPQARAQTAAHHRAALASAAKRYGVAFVWDRTVSDKSVTCDPVNEEALGCALGFLKYMETYPPSFLKAIPLRKIVLCRNLLRRGQRAGGIAYRADGRFYVVSGASSETFHHEMFHIADGVKAGD